MVKLPIAFTFANHMHWVDMEWLWGYDVLPGSVRDMLAYCEATGAKGNVNFDGIGYEKLATEDPEAFALLRDAVQSGLIEIVGGSFGQPYGLFHGGESNIRQRVYGVRTCLRLFGVRPVTFWEEEFDFFPQLPQILSGCGYRNASLFFQWTWHTPEIPFEDSPAIWWEGQDGTRLLTATRNKLNLHQWPEDIDAILESGLPSLDSEESGRTSSLDSRTSTLVPLIQQWVELMPSPDWMCRSEVLIPPMKKLLADERFEFRFQTLGEYLDSVRGSDAFPVRNYSMGDVWHGMSLGKNGDDMRRRSLQAESRLLLAETLSTIASIFGRPYPQWDVYPTWELEEAWRELLIAQHHDNDECEGLCGRVGKRQYKRAIGMPEDVVKMVQRHLFPETGWWKPEHAFHVNPFGWRTLGRDGRRTIPPLSILPWGAAKSGYGLSLSLRDDEQEITVGRDDIELSFVFDLARGGLTSIQRRNGPELANEDRPMGKFLIGDQYVDASFCSAFDEDGQYMLATYKLEDDQEFTFQINRDFYHDGLEFNFTWDLEALLRKVTLGLSGALTMEIPLPWENTHVYSDTPYAVYEVQSASHGVRKYPEGDWMTTPQWFESIEGAFTASSFVDLVEPATGEGLLIAHKGNEQWLLRDGAVRCVLSTEDPWDGSFYRERQTDYTDEGNAWRFEGEFCFIPHGPIKNSERWKLGQEFRRNFVLGPTNVGGDNIPAWGSGFVFADLDAENIVIAALYREEESFASKGLPNYAGKGMGHPFILRLVEFDGIETEAELNIVGPIAKAYKTNLMGEVEHELIVEEDSTDENGWPRARIRVPMRPFEIATLYLDIIPGRKQTRDLDAKRVVWATVHRQ